MRYKTKPIELEALEFKTNNDADNKNMNEICLWANQGSDNPKVSHNGTNIFIQTLEGLMRSNVGDFIIKGLIGEFYPCKPEVFHKKYEPFYEFKNDEFQQVK